MTQYPEKFASSMPTDMPQTGMGGTDKDIADYFAYIIASFVLLAAGAGFVYRKKNATDAQ
ncbi:hypothetical protein [Gracilibacillus boraciitolerans]|uniref:hypothetical protein n=1 Tax=Gracilibacillus boraciitolerans TaxID=307521 RepID=UPI001F271556|nr:hypothetical protein [Gracilibacillus boraciitolerans]